jgi:ABC-type polysaccharide/polyol phosphate export permease
MQIVTRLDPYKDLFLVFVWREFTIRYRHSIIGIVWAVIQPLSMIALLTFIFSYVLDVKVKEYPRVVFYFAGVLPWTFFSSSLSQSITSLSSQYTLIKKIYFPREIIPLSRIVVAFADYLIAAFLFAVVLFVYRIQITWSALWIVPLLILLIFFTMSLSLFLSSLNVYYRDVKLASEFLIRLLFFMSPIIYSIDHLDTKLKLILFLNPLTFIIENMRRCLIEGRDVVVWQFAIVSVLVIIFYFLSYRFFIKIERNFADVI